MAIVVPPALLASALSTRKRSLLVKRFKKVRRISEDTLDEIIFKRYVESGFTAVVQLRRMLADKQRLQQRISYYRKPGRELFYLADPERVISYDSRNLEGLMMAYPEQRPFMPGYRDITEMLRTGYIKEIDNVWVVDEDRMSVLADFVEYIELVGATRTWRPWISPAARLYKFRHCPTVSPPTPRAARAGLRPATVG